MKKRQTTGRENRPSAAFQSYAEALRNRDSDDEDEDDNKNRATTNPYNMKKRKQIVISFDDQEEFPSLPKTKTNKTKPNKQQSAPTPKSTVITHVTPTNNARQSTSGGDKTAMKASNDAMQAQIEMLKLQITEMQTKQEQRMSEMQEQWEKMFNHMTGKEASDRKVLKRLDDIDKDREREKTASRTIEFKANQRHEAHTELIGSLFDILKKQGETLERIERGQLSEHRFAHSRKREATDSLQKISQSMDVDNESVGSTREANQYQPKNTYGQEINEEAEATQPLTQNE